MMQLIQLDHHKTQQNAQINYKLMKLKVQTDSIAKLVVSKCK